MITVLGDMRGYKAMDLDQLHEVPVGRPNGAGPVWRGVQHGELVDTILDQCLFNGWKVVGQKFCVGKGGSTLAGAINIEIPDLAAPQDQIYSMGILTSNNMDRRLRISVGTEVKICTNGMITGDVVMARKHTTRVDLAAEIEAGLTAYREKAALIPATVAAMKDTKLTEQQVEHLLIQAGRAEVMPWSRLGDVDAEYRTPRFSDHGKGTAWCLLNAFTWVVKRNPPLEQMDQIQKFRAMLPVVVA